MVQWFNDEFNGGLMGETYGFITFLQYMTKSLFKICLQMYLIGRYTSGSYIYTIVITGCSVMTI